MEGTDQIRLVPANTKERLRQVRSLYLKAFPLRERKPFALILHKVKQEQIEVFAIENEAGEFLGEVITILYRDILLLDYFAVVPECRRMGIGRQALEAVFSRAKERRVLLEIETTKNASDNKEERIRRKNFYLKSGMNAMDYSVNLFGVEMELMTYRCEVSYAEYHALFRDLFGEAAAKHVRLIEK